MTELKCKVCAGKISRKCPSMTCRGCHCRRNLTDPSINAKRVEEMTRALGREDARQARSRGISAARRKRLAEDPEFARKWKEHGRQLGKSNVGNRNQGPGSEARRAVGRKLTERFLGWCPPHLREEYRKLKRNSRKSVEECRTIILAKEAERLAAMSPFERTMERIRNGAPLVMKQPIRRHFNYTLGGVTGEIV